jgi:hypothetical protein
MPACGGDLGGLCAGAISGAEAGATDDRAGAGSVPVAANSRCAAGGGGDECGGDSVLCAVWVCGVRNQPRGNPCRRCLSRRAFDVAEIVTARARRATRRAGAAPCRAFLEITPTSGEFNTSIQRPAPQKSGAQLVHSFATFDKIFCNSNPNNQLQFANKLAKTNIRTHARPKAPDSVPFTSSLPRLQGNRTRTISLESL